MHLRGLLNCLILSTILASTIMPIMLGRAFTVTRAFTLTASCTASCCTTRLFSSKKLLPQLLPQLRPIIPVSFDDFRVLPKAQRDEVIKLWQQMGGGDERDVEKWCIDVTNGMEATAKTTKTTTETIETTETTNTQQGYILRFDGGSRGNPGPAGSGYVIYDPDGSEIHAGWKFLGERTNNFAEYSGLIEGLEKAKQLGVVGTAEGDR